MFDIIPILALKDNYIWCAINRANQRCVIVDPGESAPVFAALSAHQLTLSAILITHHHWDHTHGITEILSRFNVPVYGPALENVANMTHPLNDGDEIFLQDLDLRLQIKHIPGHTLGHIAYFNQHFLLSGDTLFTAGCGRIFEGTVAQMFASLTALATLGDNVLVYCGHEYTASNLRFAALVEPNNRDIQMRSEEVAKRRAQNLPTVPASLALEKRTNPFLRCEHPNVINAAEIYAGKSLSTPQDVLAIIREWKNQS